MAARARTAALSVPAPAVSRSRFAAARDVARRMLRDPYTVVGLCIYLVFVLVAVFADQLATHDPTEILFRANGRVASNRPPGEGFILGTTNLGRDIYSQLVYGSRSALLVGLTAAVFVVAIGTLTGLVSGYFGRWIDTAIMRLADVALAIPFLPFVIVLA